MQNPTGAQLGVGGANSAIVLAVHELKNGSKRDVAETASPWKVSVRLEA